MAGNKPSSRRLDSRLEKQSERKPWPALLLLGVLLVASGCASQSQLFDGEPTDDGAAQPQLVSDDEPADDHDAALPRLPGDLAEATWVELTPSFPELPDGQTVEIFDSISNGETVWAVGNVSNQYRFGGLTGESTFQTQAAIWRSDEGQTWQAVDIGLDPLSTEVGDVTNIRDLQHIVATDDGALWAFGRIFGENEGESATKSVLAFRSGDGMAWESLEVAVDGQEITSVSSVDSVGNTVAVIAWDEGLSDADGPTALFTTDGGSWTASREPQSGFQIVIQDLPNETVDVSALATEEPTPVDVARSSDFSVITGYTSDSGVSAWFSNGNEWNEADRPLPPRFNEQVLGLVPYDQGVLAAIEGAPVREDDVNGTLLWDIDSSGTVTNLGVAPTAFFYEMFVVDDQFVIIGGEALEADRGQIDLGAPQYSIWVAEFS